MTNDTPSADMAGRARMLGFTRDYWMLNSIEMFERLAYYLVRSVVAIYIMQADETHGLHFTAAQKGTIYSLWFVFQSLLPTFTGGFADRYGYKKMLTLAITLNVAGYIMMGTLTSYAGFSAAIIVLATGSAFFKPSLQGSLAHNVSDKNSSLGWGIFYWVVNIGAFIGPLLANWLRFDFGWQAVFFTSAGFMALNYFMLFTFRDFESGADKTDGPVKVFLRTIKNLSDLRLVAWLLIMSCFWLMMYTLWDLQPNFLTDWNDSGDVAAFIRSIPFAPAGWVIETERGIMVPQELLMNLNAAMIVIFMVPVSWFVRKLKTLESMIIGMGMATVGVLVAGFTNVGFVFLAGVVGFSLGEMLTGPKKNEYLGLISPPGKKGQYLGYVNIPVGIGGLVGSKLQGFVYGNWGEKAVLAQKYLATEVPGAGGWDGELASLDAASGVVRPDAFARLMEVTNLDAMAATDLLWNHYSPQYAVWIPFACIGVAAIIALVAFARAARNWGNMNA
ncbi:MAG: peptide MFS transporter [bacterium]|nr:peptide MFS transporter [bacterium]